jgi:hypothetical protein
MSGKIQPKKKSAGRCITEGCDKPIHCLGLCLNCYQFDRYWTKFKNAAERRKRMKDLELYQTRMEAIQPPKLRSVK